MAKYKVQLEDWQGPLDLLLQLIEKQELDITEVSLSEVADQYIEYMNVKPVSAEETADFLVVAAKLIYLKSKALLPDLEVEEDDGIDLAKQLKMYKEYVDASKKIQKFYNNKNYCYSKNKFPEGITEQVFYVSKSVTKNRLKNIYSLVLARIIPVVVLPKKVIQKSIKLSQRIQEIRELIMKKACTSFNKMLCDSKNKTEKIVSFLAILELTKQKIIHVEQADLFDDITLNKIN